MQTLHSATDAAQWLLARGATNLQTDSRQLRAGEAFVAWPGAAVDGRQFVPHALNASAAAALVEARNAEAFNFVETSIAGVQDLKVKAGPIAAQFYGNPSQALALIAVTGTNGKTSTAWWLAQALSLLPGELAMPCGLIGTLGVGQPPLPHQVDVGGLALVSTGMTTPDPVLLQKTLRRFLDAGLKACAIEVSSIG
ncbi:MAG: Mur ligase family protein, partial [Rhodoferax sp.]